MPDPQAPAAPAGNAGVAPKTPLQNQTLGQLYAVADSLQNVIRTTQDLPTYRAANDEYGSVQDRISTLLNLQLTQDTAEMKAAAPGIAQAKSSLDAALQGMTQASDLINGVTNFLKAVDVLITAAKIAAAV